MQFRIDWSIETKIKEDSIKRTLVPHQEVLESNEFIYQVF